MRSNQVKVKKQSIVFLRHKLFLCLVLFLMVPLFFVSRNIFTGFTQTANKSEKIVTKETFKNEAIEFFELETGEKTVQFKKKFTQEGEWLKDFTFKFRNISGKPITYVSIAIAFPETESTERRIVHFLRYGINPLAPPNKIDKPAFLLPDKTAELKLSEKEFSILKDHLNSKKYLFADLAKVHLTIMGISFEDGTYWSTGSIFA